MLYFPKQQQQQQQNFKVSHFSSDLDSCRLVPTRFKVHLSKGLIDFQLFLAFPDASIQSSILETEAENSTYENYPQVLVV